MDHQSITTIHKLALQNNYGMGNVQRRRDTLLLCPAFGRVSRKLLGNLPYCHRQRRDRITGLPTLAATADRTIREYDEQPHYPCSTCGDDHYTRAKQVHPRTYSYHYCKPSLVRLQATSISTSILSLSCSISNPVVKLARLRFLNSSSASFRPPSHAPYSVCKPSYQQILTQDI